MAANGAPGTAAEGGEWPAANRLIGLAIRPGLLVARVRPDLRTSIAQDAIRFAGSAASLFSVLAVLAVAYPIAASLAHALGGQTQGGNALTYALRPGFDVVYAESIPFMLGALGIGLLSPMLGVLFLTIFIPADLIAANGTVELANMPWQWPGSAILARIASYGLLWILAVEIPLRSRALALGWARRGASNAATRAAVGLVVLTAGFVYLWAVALSLLIMPVYTWTVVQAPNRLASDPTWFYWPILVAGAAALAGLAAVWPRPLAAASAVGVSPHWRSRSGPRSTSFTLARQTAVSLFLALLLGGLMTNATEAIVIIVGLLVAGPVLTVILPGLPTPAFLARATPAKRFVGSMALVLVADVLIEIVIGKAMFATDYLPLTVLVVGSIIVFRTLIGAGVGPARPVSRSADMPSALQEGAA